MDPMQNPQVQQMLMALMQQQGGGGVTPQAQPAQDLAAQQQASLGNGMIPPGAGMLQNMPPNAPAMTPPPVSPY